jgi:hypothetical protein
MAGKLHFQSGNGRPSESTLHVGCRMEVRLAESDTRAQKDWGEGSWLSWSPSDPGVIKKYVVWLMRAGLPDKLIGETTGQEIYWGVPAVIGTCALRVDGVMADGTVVQGLPSSDFEILPLKG